ncbi:hypothetical protein [Limnoglobus roseus]|uniref:Uncharacterized protein n=1 Tax=Limnoglobus roseus TaxID=2598579 RepID=A0A5C1AAY0_9BACT|nr:hypothetical protein [Limnoglobus roseus]QEL15176.1 hypothetical protein PX52LOC_02091 [Limnoglobus roseus]
MTTESWPLWQKVAAVAVVLGVSAGGLWLVVSALFPPRPAPMTAEEFQSAFRKADAEDRENWEKMWRAAGKTPPPE